VAALAASPAAAAAGITSTDVGGVQVIIDSSATPAPAVKATGKTGASGRGGAPYVPPLEPSGLPGADALIRLASAFVGVPYVWGGASPSGFDCSGFTWYVYRRLGINIPRTADVQFAQGRSIAGDPLPGDLVFFQTYDYGASHVGIYLGGGRFINAIGPNVHVDSFATGYFRSRYLGARRFLPG
jgi:cell wall-associated NlpC family hydrolase